MNGRRGSRSHENAAKRAAKRPGGSLWRSTNLVVSQLVWIRSLNKKLNSYNANSSLLTIEWE